MATKFSHLPNEIIATMLWSARGIGTDPTWWASHTVKDRVDATHDWPVFWGTEPDSPDEVITVYEAAPQIDARIMPTGENVRHYGITIRVKGRTQSSAGAKAAELEHDLNELLYDQKLTIDTTEYSIQSMRAAVTPAMRLQSPNNQLWFANVNCLAVILAYPTGR